MADKSHSCVNQTVFEHCIFCVQPVKTCGSVVYLLSSHYFFLKYHLIQLQVNNLDNIFFLCRGVALPLNSNAENNAAHTHTHIINQHTVSELTQGNCQHYLSSPHYLSLLLSVWSRSLFFLGLTSTYHPCFFY